MPSNVDAPSRRELRFVHWVLWGAVAIALLVAVATYDDYGTTLDEALQAQYGELALAYFESGGEDVRCNEFRDLRFYGPLVEMIPALLYRDTDVVKYDVRHLFLGLVAVFLIPAVWLYGRQFQDPRVAAFAVIAAATMPALYGHWFNNSKDTSFALLVAWFMAALAVAFTEPRLRWSRAILCGVAMGLALCGRPGGFPLLLLFLAVAAATSLLTREGGGSKGLVAAGAAMAPKLAGLLGIAWVVMVAPWPWAHQSPILHPLEAMRTAAKFATTVPVLFDGVTYRSDALPWFYLPKSLLITTPLSVLALAALGTALGVVRQVTSWGSRTARMVTLTEAWLFVVLLLFVVLRPNTYGGIRHFLFVLPAVGVLAGYGAAELLARAASRRHRALTWVALLAVLVSPVWHLVRLHPYQAAYYNALVGGVGGASRGYWTDWYYASYVEAIEWVNAQAAADPRGKVVVVLAAGSAGAIMPWAAEYAAPNVELQSLHELGPERKTLAPADYFIASTRNRADLTFPEAPVVHEIGRDGAVFTVVKGRR